MALAEDLRTLAEFGLIEIAVDEVGHLRCAPTDSGKQVPLANTTADIRAKEQK